MTLEALITAKASLPSVKPRDCTDVLVIMETSSTPGATSRVTSEFTAHWTIFITLPLRIFRALIFIIQDSLFRTVSWQFDSQSGPGTEASLDAPIYARASATFGLSLAPSALSLRDNRGSDAFGQALAILSVLHVSVVLRVGKEPEFAEHSRTAVLAKDAEIVAFDSAFVGGVSATGLSKDVRGKAPRSRTEVIDFDPAGAPARRPIIVNTDEDAVSGGVGDRSARFQGDKDVAGSRFDHAEAFAAENRRQPAGCVKCEDLFRVPGNRSAPIIVSPMSRIDDDRIELPGSLPIRRCAARQENCDQQDCT